MSEWRVNVYSRGRESEAVAYCSGWRIEPTERGLKILTPDDKVTELPYHILSELKRRDTRFRHLGITVPMSPGQPPAPESTPPPPEETLLPKGNLDIPMPPVKPPAPEPLVMEGELRYKPPYSYGSELLIKSDASTGSLAEIITACARRLERILNERDVPYLPVDYLGKVRITVEWL